MKRSLLIVFGICFAATVRFGIPAAASQADASGLPIYPGAVAVPGSRNERMIRCGHVLTVTTYSIQSATKTIADWYGARIPRGIRYHSAAIRPTITMTVTNIIEPNGAKSVSIVQAIVANAATPQPVMIGLETIKPAFSANELQAMRSINGNLPVAKHSALNRVKARCGP